MSIESVRRLEDRLNAEQGYISYLSGVAILSGPEHMQPLHNISPDNLEAIVLCAEDIMYSGLKEVIQHSHPGGGKRGLAAMEKMYDTALPVMAEMVDAVVEKRRSGIDRMNEFLYTIKPAPFLNRVIYEYICHSRKYKITAIDLMGGMQPAENVRPLVGSRSLSDPLLAVRAVRSA